MKALPDRLMTPEEFHAWHEQQDGKFELYEGRVVPRFGWRYEDDGSWTMMAGANNVHNRIAGNLYFAMRRQLACWGCEVFGSDTAIRTGPKTVRYPEVSVICDREELEAVDEDHYEFSRPTLVVEVFSKSSEKFDRGEKLSEYQSIPDLQVAVLIHPGRRWIAVYERLSATEWRNTNYFAGAPLTLTHPALTLTAEDVFGPS